MTSQLEQPDQYACAAAWAALSAAHAMVTEQLSAAHAAAQAYWSGCSDWLVILGHQPGQWVNVLSVPEICSSS